MYVLKYGKAWKNIPFVPTWRTENIEPIETTAQWGTHQMKWVKSKEIICSLDILGQVLLKSQCVEAVYN